MLGRRFEGRFRWAILGLMLVISMITYLDRINIAIAGQYIRSTYGLSDVQMGKIFSTFVIGYGLFMIPAGWMGDKFGPRRMLTFALIWWSVFTAVTAVAGDMFTAGLLGVVGSFVLIRFLIGAGEAAAFPNFNRTIAFWMAPSERAFANSLVLGASGLGGAVTPPLIGWIMETYGWRESFYFCGAIGLVIAVLWYACSTNRPEEHPRVNQAELAVIQAQDVQSKLESSGGQRLSLAMVLRSRNIWILTLSNALFGYVAYIYLTWFYLYLVDVRQFSVLKSSFYGMLPFIAITVMTPIGGAFSDHLCKRVGRRWGRRSVVMLGMSMTAVCVALGGALENAYAAVMTLALGAGFLYFSISPYWATVIDIARENTGLISGIMSGGGNLGGSFSPTITPILASAFGWSAALNVAALAALLGGILWFFIDPEEPVVRSLPAKKVKTLAVEAGG